MVLRHGIYPRYRELFGSEADELYRMASRKSLADLWHMSVIPYRIFCWRLKSHLRKGISFYDGHALAPWKIIYLLLGGLAIVVGVCVLIWMPDSPVHAIRLNQEGTLTVSQNTAL
jgi:hypothetical protein